MGGSFIACEVAASLTSLGHSCTLIMQEQLPMERVFGSVIGCFVADLLTGRGVQILAGEDVTAFLGEDRVRAVAAGSCEVEADAVVVGVGAVPDASLAARAGLTLGESGGVLCDGRLQASADGVYAAGDVCEYESSLHGRTVRVEHERHAIAQGKTAARNILGDDVDHLEPPYFWTELADWATLEYVGVALDWDEEIRRGDLEAGRFTQWHARNGVVVGAVAVNRPGDIGMARDLVADRASVSRLPASG